MNFYNNCYHLKIFIDSDDTDLISLYENHVDNHNKKIIDDYPFSDSGFDIYIPKTVIFEPKQVTKVSSLLKCALYFENTPSAFYVYPRSSISKTPLRLANQVGIIDSGYRGSLIGAFDNISEINYDVSFSTRLLQICAPDLKPIHVEIVKNIDELKSTNRGTGGFGSTGVSDTYGYMDIADKIDSNNFDQNYIEPVD